MDTRIHKRGAGNSSSLSPSVKLSRVLGSLGRITDYSKKRLGLREIGGILTQSLLPSYHLFSNLHENRMSIGDFYDLACFNCLSYFICLGPISGLNRHQRHQDALFALLARFAVLERWHNPNGQLKFYVDTNLRGETARRGVASELATIRPKSSNPLRIDERRNPVRDM